MTATDLLRSGRSSMEPTREDRERVRNRLAAKLGAAAVGATITTTTAKAAGATAAAKTGTAALALKIFLPLLVLGGAAAIATPRLLHRAAAPAPAPVAAPVVVAATAPPVEPVTSVSVDELPTVTTPKPALAKKPVTLVTDPAEEAKLVASIDAALRAGDSATALRVADEHAKKYPNGVLVEEREGGRSIARCMSGSRSSADAFLAAHPRSPMRARIVAACGEKP